MTSDGYCAIKNEFMVKKEIIIEKVEIKPNTEATDEPEAKKIKLEENGEKNNDKKNNGKQKKRGQNKGRPRPKREAPDSLPCNSIVNVHVGKEPENCKFANCVYIHDPVEYLKVKTEDISINGGDCYVYKTRGECPWGLRCRFGSSHLSAEGHNIVDDEKLSKWIDETSNCIKFDALINLQRRQYNFKDIEKIVELETKRVKGRKDADAKALGDVTDEDIVPLRECEKKKIDWKDKLYLGPLTTLGNLPFRRICKEFGADITCGEMVMCDSLLKGTKQEWALVKRHQSEDLFGVQICGTNPYVISKVAHVVNKEINVDFVDLNLGCPIDLVYQRGGGCGMLLRQNVLEISVKCASSLLSVPFTIKTRIGVHQGTKIAHNLAPKFFEWGASLVTVHGRSREQRYTKLSDWPYINECAALCKPNPVFGNGDVMSYEDYIKSREVAPNVSGVMICRGGLIKPWIFTEIKEQRLWDISSSERFEMLKKYANYGLSHWGADSRGVENTRRFLLEWCSFLYRYVPIGLLERPPQKINERPPYYFGRDDLETLMASSNCADWIKLSEMLLGPVPDGFQFLPKHKANSYK